MRSKSNFVLSQLKICILFFLVVGQHCSIGQKDNTSKVPKYTFGTTLNEQERQLENNPLIKRFEESRELLANDKHRPYYHYINPEGRLNDPNGLSFWQGRWHLFYQAYPPEDPRQHWGHAVSEDLIHWRDLPYAIYPNPEDKVFSGSTWVENDRVIAMYHGVGVGTMVATSNDPLLLNWEKLTGNAVIPFPKEGTSLPYNIFDPNIWKKGDSYYTLLAGTRPVGPGGKKVRANFLLKSKDLTQWEYLHPFIENDMYSMVGDDGACPYFWPIGNEGKYILLHFSHMSGGKYLIGDYDQVNDKFLVSDGDFFNHGPVSHGGLHAPSAFPDGKGGVIAIFNMNSGIPIGNGNFTEMMTLPRLLSLDENDKLIMKPIESVSKLRESKKEMKEVKLPANNEIVLDGIEGKAMELKMTVDLKKSNNIEIKVLRSPNEEEYTRIVFIKNGGYNDRSEPGKNTQYSSITLDNSMGSLSSNVHPRTPETANVLIKENETIELNIFIDRSIVEVYVNNRQCLSLRTYPDREDSQTVSVISRGNDASIKNIEAWQMKNLYVKD